MSNKKGCILSILLGCFIIGVSIPLFMTNHKKVKADTITNLTNTTWIFNQSLDVNSIGTYTGTINYYINYTLDDVNYGYVTFGSTNGTRYNAFTVGNKDYMSMSGWMTGLPDPITITGGSDVTNNTFITWLQSNATQQIPTPTGTQITYKYWSPYGVIRMSDNYVVGDEEISYTVLFNEQRRQYDETTQTGLIFKGMITTDNEPHSYIESIASVGINILYMGDNNNLYNSMWLEFTYGDYMDTDLYEFMDLWGLWFDDADPYLVGMNQGYAEGTQHGIALGQADGTQYTTLISNIFNGIGGLLSIQVFPNITIGLLIGLPLLLGVLVIILKILRG